jgi:hypothetical protein
MELLSERDPPQAGSVHDGALFYQPDGMLSDHSSQVKTTTSTLISAATPRTSHLLPHESADFMDAAFAPEISTTNELPCFTTNLRQLPTTTRSLVKSFTKQSSQLDSPLLSKLPRELRDKIYREAVYEDVEIPINVASYKSKDGEHRRRLELEHALLLVCKQTRHEVADIYYLENTFCITNDLFEKRAISQLNRALRPWAEKITQLEIFHKLLVFGCCTADIDFSVSASQARILVEALTSNIRDPCTTEHIFYLIPARMCYCEALCLALAHGSGNVLDWVEQYVDMVVQSQATQAAENGAPYCWTCAGHIII